LESFKSLDNVKKTKFELADSLDSNGMLFLNGEDENILSFNKNPNAILYGLTPKCNYYAENLVATADGTKFSVTHNGKTVEFTTSLIGKHNVINLLSAIAVCCELGIPLEKLPPYVRKVKSVEHRLQLIKRGTTTVIDDAYNSNPSGAKAAIDTLALFDGYKVVITPGMIELGSVEDDENYKFGQHMAEVCDYIVLVGKKQTESIYKGLVDAGFDKEKIYVSDNLNDGAQKAFGLNAGNQQKIVLFENDLPDNY
jgi:UDP-N-acetylmuramoyl-tripeptide--D-alanyl-D-alanine ligase